MELLSLLLSIGKDRTRLHPVTFEVAQSIIAQLVEALEYLKSLQIVHRGAVKRSSHFKVEYFECRSEA